MRALRRGKWLRFAVAVLVCFAARPSLAQKRCGPPNAVLDSLESTLDRLGIDTQSSWELKELGNRPIVAELDGYPSDVLMPDRASWMVSFASPSVEHFGAALPAKRLGTKLLPRSREAFDAAWTTARQGSKIFLSFTSADRKHAQSIANALEEKGYKTFLFLQDDTPDLTIDEVRRYFDEAGGRYVLDSVNARKSVGIWLEAEFAPGPRSSHSGATSAALKSLEKRLALRTPLQASHIARYAPDLKTLRRVADAIQEDKQVCAGWAELNEFGVQKALRARTSLSTKADDREMFREPLRAAQLQLQQDVFERGCDRLKSALPTGGDKRCPSVCCYNLLEPLPENLGNAENSARARLEKLRDHIEAEPIFGSPQAPGGLNPFEAKYLDELKSVHIAIARATDDVSGWFKRAYR